MVRSYGMAEDIGIELPSGNEAFDGEMSTPSRMQIREIAKVLLPNGAVLGVVTLSSIELILKISLLVASLAYTVLHTILLWKKLRSKRPPEDASI